MSDDLLPCPFCGELPAITKHFKAEMYGLMHRCAVVGPISFSFGEKACHVAEWNRRAPLPAEQPSNPVALTDREIDEYFRRAGVEMQYVPATKQWLTRGSFEVIRLRNAVKLIEARIVGQQTKGGGNV